MTAPATQFESPEDSETRILSFIREYPQSTQREIAAGVSLSRAAVAKLIGAETKRQTPGHGRRPVQAPEDPGPLHGPELRCVLVNSGDRPARFSIRHDLGCVIAIDMGGGHLRGRIADLAGGLLAAPFEHGQGWRVLMEPDWALDEAANIMKWLLAEAGLPSERVAGVAIGVPFPYDAAAEAVIAPREGGWHRVSLPSELYQEHRVSWEAPSLVASIDQFGAIAELDAALQSQGLTRLRRSTTDLLYLKWSTSIAAAIVTRGEIQPGFRGLAGQFAHTPLSRPPIGLRPCPRCGRICLDSQASLRAIVERLGLDSTKLGPSPEARAQELVRRATEGDVAVKQILDEAAVAVGRALGAALNTLNSHVVIVGGAFGSADFRYVSALVNEGIDATVYPPAREHVVVQPGRCTGEAGVVGGLSAALRAYSGAYLLRLVQSGDEIPPPPVEDPAG